jgi:hypothetical protein
MHSVIRMLAVLALFAGGLCAAAVASRPAAARSDAGALFPSVVVDVPGRRPSVHFAAQVCTSAGTWVDVYVWETTAKPEIKSPHNGYFGHLAGWTTSWVSSQLPSGGTGSEPPLQLRVRRIGGEPIAHATVHPVSSTATVTNITADGVVTLAVQRTARIAVDFDGAMDTTDTGPGYSGPAVHAFCWFIDEAPAPGTLPDANAPGTVVVRPGDPWPGAPELDPLAWPTVIFAPGVHRGGTAPRNWTVYNLTAQTRYFLCAGAVVHGALSAGKGSWGQNGIVVDGFGVLSGEEMWREDDPDNNSPQGVSYAGVKNSSLLGVTLVDFPNHHIILGQSAGDVLRNVKVLGWRSNGDGVHVFNSWTVSDLFLRTQDDSLYLSCGDKCSATFDRITTWNDANGVAFLFSPGGGSAEAGVVLRDSDAIYSRTSWYWWGPNTVFVNRGDAPGHAMSGVRVENVRVEDPRPAFNPFRLELLTPAAGATFRDITFVNITVQNFSTIRHTLGGRTPLPYGIPNSIFAAAPCSISNVAFDNVTIAGRPMRDLVRYPSIFNLSAGLVNVTVDGTPIVRAS